MEISDERLKQIGQVAIQNLSWPVRLPSFNEPSFWSWPLNLTLARPLSDGSGWVDAINVPARNGFKLSVQGYVASSQVEGGVDFRWIRNGFLLDDPAVSLTPGIERHIERDFTHPYPAIFRKIHILAKSNDTLQLQVNNSSGAQQVVFAGVWGWYYPDLQNPNEFTELEGIDDVARDF